MKIKAASAKECIKFLHEVIEEFAEASTYYGLMMDTDKEDEASNDYEQAWKKMHNALKLVLKVEVSDAR